MPASGERESAPTQPNWGQPIYTLPGPSGSPTGAPQGDLPYRPPPPPPKWYDPTRPRNTPPGQGSTPFPGDVTTIPSKQPGYYGGAYNKVFKSKVKKQKAKRQAAIERAQRQLLVVNQARAARVIMAGTVSDAVIGANLDVANQILGEMATDKWARERGGAAAAAELARYGDAAAAVSPFSPEQIARTVDRPLVGYEPTLGRLPGVQTTVPTYSPPLVGPGAYNETIYGPDTETGVGTYPTTAPRTDAVLDPRGAAGRDTTVVPYQTPGINPAVGPGPQTVIDKFLEAVTRQLTTAVQQFVTPRPRGSTSPRPFTPGLTGSIEPPVGSAPQVFPGQTTPLNVATQTRPDTSPQVDTGTQQCERGAGPPKKKGKCAQGYYRQNVDGTVEYKQWSERKCRS